MAGPRRASRPRIRAGESTTERERPVQPRGTAKDRALRLLSFRDRSRRELEQRLLRAGFEPEEVASAIESLEAVGLVDDERFAAQVAEQATRGRLSGRRAVLGSLLGKGVARQLAERTAESLAPTEEARAEELAARQAPRMRDLDPAVAFRRLSSLLIRRGFEPGVSFEVSRRVLGEPSEDG